MAGAQADDVDGFRRELRTWLADHVTPEVAALGASTLAEDRLDALRAWNATLADGGWAAPAWPEEHGGRGADVAQQVAYLEEMDAASAPGPVNVIGVSNIAPAIMAFGTEAQQQRFLRPMLRGDEIWSQGMSEPDAGSDLASLRTTAELDGDHYVVNGQKTWNSLGHHADWCQLYVRSDPDARKHRGISCLLVDLSTPGIEARPLRTITGDHTFAELFFDDVRVPRSALLGQAEQGWTVAMTTLSFERAGVARLHLMLARRLGALLADPAARQVIADDRLLRNRCAALHARIACMRWLTARSLADVGAHGGAGGSLAKLSWSGVEQDLANLAMDVVGLAGQGGPWAVGLASARQASIAGGTTEVNRNIIAEHILGLPRDR